MILLDTSAWIEFLKPRSTFKITEDQLELVCTCHPIYQELLQGIRDDLVFQQLKNRFQSLIFLDDPIPADRYLEAAQIYRQGRKRGLTIRSSQDALIAAIAIHHDVLLIHQDRDFEAISRYTSLKTATKMPR
jgi:predicted nucleic acid-binding protein